MDLLVINGYIPHGHCYLWQTPLVFLHAISDLLIAIAYYSIPIILLYFLRQLREIPFYKIIVLFSAFILFCGTTHLLEIITLWFPFYWISGVMKALTAMISVFTVFELIHIIPQALNLKSPKELEALNNELNNQIKEREAVDIALRELNSNLEQRVQERTRELAYINCQLEQEIEYRKKAQKAIEEAQNFTKKVIDITPNIIYIYDLENHQPIYSNRLITEMLGYQPDLESLLFPNYIHPDDYPRLEKSLTDLQNLSENQYINLEYRIKDSQDHWRWVNCRKTVFERNDDGNVKEFIANFEDITDRKHTEMSLRQNKEQLAQLAAIVIISKSPQGAITNWNNAAERLFGYTSQEMLGHSIEQLIPEELRAEEDIILQNIREGKQLDPYETQRKHKNGNLIDVSLTISPIWDEWGNVVGASKIIRDISERKQSELQLRSLSDRLELALNSAQIGVWDWDIKQDRLIWDKRMYQIYGVSPTDFAQNYEAWQRLLHPEDRLYSSETSPQALLSQNDYEGEFRSLHPDGSVRFIKAYGLIQNDHGGNPSRMIGINFDITASKEQEQQIYEQRRRELLLREITQNIRQSLELPTIFNTVVQEIRQFLQVDRVAIFQFEPETNFERGSVVAESVIAPFSSIINIPIQEQCFSTKYAIQYQAGRIQVMEDIYESNLLECYINFLAQFQIRANLVLPLINDARLWGLLCIHQCSDSRTWQISEINLLKQITSQFEIAIQQATLYQQSQQELAEKNELFIKLSNELDQKKILLKEIHHRVKNNLQIMSSLLYLQFSKASPEIQELSEDYQNRIQSMALIHEQLYRSEDLTNINFHEYITNLTHHIFQGYGTELASTQLILEIQEIAIALDQSIPLGLIIHELVSNALKHAFPTGLGQITIKLGQVEHQISLSVGDNGMGIPPDLDLEYTDSLGMQLI